MTPTTPAWDLHAIREDFPALGQRVHGRPLVYFDNAATTQKPRRVVDAMTDFYQRYNANVHRGVHYLSALATEAYEASRSTVQRFISAGAKDEIIFTRGATESINLVAHSFGQRFVKAGDEILLTELEHHSNIVPWQMLCERSGATLKVAPIDDPGDLRLDGLERLLTDRTRLVALTHISNALGTVNPVAEVIAMAQRRGIRTLVDGAQAVAHQPVDVRALGCDFYAFSAHKMFGPTGVGVLYGRRELLEQMPPFLGGGDMVRTVSFEKTTYLPPPGRFEAGTPDIAGVIGLAAAIDYLQAIDRTAASSHERQLMRRLVEALTAAARVRVIGNPAERAASVSFAIAGVHPHDIATILDQHGVAIRAGHHCAQPLMRRLGLPATARASLAFYNTPAEIDVLIAAIGRVTEVFP